MYQITLHVLFIVLPILALLPSTQLAAALMNGGSVSYYLGLMLLILAPIVVVQIVYKQIRSLIALIQRGTHEKDSSSDRSSSHRMP